MANTPYTDGYFAGQQFAVDKILAYLDTQTSECIDPAEFAAELVRLFEQVK